MVIQAELTERDHSVAPGEVLQDGPVHRLHRQGDVRVEPDGGVQHRFALGHLDDAAVLGRLGADIDDLHNAGRAGPLQDPHQVALQAVEVDMGVGVNRRFGHAVCLLPKHAPRKRGG